MHSGAVRRSESDASVLRVPVGMKLPFVDDHVVVEPAQEHQIRLVGASALGPWDDVMCLETIG